MAKLPKAKVNLMVDAPLYIDARQQLWPHLSRIFEVALRRALRLKAEGIHVDQIIAEIEGAEEVVPSSQSQG
ncbi:MAG: hypothetical protein ACE5JP_10705 [Candidatus Bipolaricaulia bacterium]